MLPRSAALDEVRGATSTWADAEAADGATLARLADRPRAGDDGDEVPLTRAAFLAPPAGDDGAGAAQKKPEAALAHARDALDALTRRTFYPLPDAMRALLCDVVAYELDQARALRDMTRTLAELKRGVAAAEAKYRGAGPGAPNAKDLDMVRTAREKHAREFQAGLVLWSLPKFAEARARVLSVFAAHVELFAGVLGAPVADSRCRVQPVIPNATAVLAALDLERPDLGRFLKGPPAPAFSAPPPGGTEERKSEVDDAPPPPRKSEVEVAV